MTFDQVGQLFDRIVDLYPMFSGDVPKMRTWQHALNDISLGQALKALSQYAANPDNKFPPHPGALISRQGDVNDHDRDKIETAHFLALRENSRVDIVPPPVGMKEALYAKLGIARTAE